MCRYNFILPCRLKSMWKSCTLFIADKTPDASNYQQSSQGQLQFFPTESHECFLGGKRQKHCLNNVELMTCYSRNENIHTILHAPPVVTDLDAKDWLILLLISSLSSSSILYPTAHYYSHWITVVLQHWWRQSPHAVWCELWDSVIWDYQREADRRLAGSPSTHFLDLKVHLLFKQAWTPEDRWREVFNFRVMPKRLSFFY